MNLLMWPLNKSLDDLSKCHTLYVFKTLLPFSIALLTSSVVQVPIKDLLLSVCLHLFWLLISVHVLHKD